MPESIEKPEDRPVSELLKGLKRSIEQAKDGEGTSNVEELKQKYRNKRERQE